MSEQFIEKIVKEDDEAGVKTPPLALPIATPVEKRKGQSKAKRR